MKKIVIFFILFYITISCKGANNPMKYENILSKYSFIKEMYEEYERVNRFNEQNNNLISYIEYLEQNRKSIENFKMIDFNKKNVEYKLEFLSREIIRLENEGFYYKDRDIWNFYKNEILNLVIQDNGNIYEKYRVILGNNFNENEIELLLKELFYNFETEEYEIPHYKKGDENNKLVYKIENELRSYESDTVETDNTEFEKNYSDKIKKENKIIKKKIAPYMNDKINYYSMEPSNNYYPELVHISKDKKRLLIMYVDVELNNAIKYGEIKIKNYNRLTMNIYKNTLYIGDGEDIYSIYLDKKGESKIIKLN